MSAVDDAAAGETVLQRALAEADRAGLHTLVGCIIDGGCIDMAHCPPGTQLVAAGVHMPRGAYLAVLPCYGAADEGLPGRHMVDARREPGSVVDLDDAPPHARLVASVGVRLPPGSGIVLRGAPAGLPAETTGARPPRPRRRPATPGE